MWWALLSLLGLLVLAAWSVAGALGRVAEALERQNTSLGLDSIALDREPEEQP